MISLSIEEIIEVNRQVIATTGADHGLAGMVVNANSLHHIVVAGESEFGGYRLYPTAYHRAAIYAYLINRDHVFFDGNKRTSMICALWFLSRNGVPRRADLADADIVDMALKIACGSVVFEDVVQWCRDRVVGQPAGNQSGTIPPQRPGPHKPLVTSSNLVVATNQAPLPGSRAASPGCPGAWPRFLRAPVIPRRHSRCVSQAGKSAGRPIQ